LNDVKSRNHHKKELPPYNNKVPDQISAKNLEKTSRNISTQSQITHHEEFQSLIWQTNYLGNYMNEDNRLNHFATSQ
jgi:hypothetical protein